MADHTVLITGAGGHIGLELVPQLLQTQKARLVLPTRNADRLQSSLPSDASRSKVVIEESSIRDPNFVESIIVKHNVDTVFLCLTGTDELMTSLNFLDAMERAAPRVKHLVYLSAAGDYVTSGGVTDIMKRCSAAHVLVKTTLEQKLKHGDLPWTTTVIGPTLFFSNDLRSKSQMLEHGFFDEPLGEGGVSRVCTSDIARAVTNVIVDPTNKGIGKKVCMGSLKKFTGREVVRLWSEAIGKPVTMAVPDQAFEEAFSKKMAGSSGKDGIDDDTLAWARDLRLMYQTLGQDVGFGMSDEEYQLQVDVLGKEPEDYEAWVKATGAGWR